MYVKIHPRVKKRNNLKAKDVHKVQISTDEPFCVLTTPIERDGDTTVTVVTLVSIKDEIKAKMRKPTYIGDLTALMPYFSQSLAVALDKTETKIDIPKPDLKPDIKLDLNPDINPRPTNTPNCEYETSYKR